MKHVKELIMKDEIANQDIENTAKNERRQWMLLKK